MATLQVSVPDDWLAEFESKFSPEQRAEMLVGALIGLVQEDPYSAEALAQDEAAYQAALAGDFLTHEDVMASLQNQIDAVRSKST